MWWISEIRTEEDASFCLKYMMLQMEFLKLMFKNLRAQLYNFIQKSEWMHKCFFWSFYLASRSLIEQDTRKLFFFFSFDSIKIPNQQTGSLNQLFQENAINFSSHPTLLLKRLPIFVGLALLVVGVQTFH